MCTQAMEYIKTIFSTKLRYTSPIYKVRSMYIAKNLLYEHTSMLNIKYNKSTKSCKLLSNHMHKGWVMHTMQLKSPTCKASNSLSSKNHNHRAHQHIKTAFPTQVREKNTTSPVTFIYRRVKQVAKWPFHPLNCHVPIVERGVPGISGYNRLY